MQVMNPRIKLFSIDVEMMTKNDIFTMMAPIQLKTSLDSEQHILSTLVSGSAWVLSPPGFSASYSVGWRTSLELFIQDGERLSIQATQGSRMELWRFFSHMPNAVTPSPVNAKARDWKIVLSDNSEARRHASRRKPDAPWKIMKFWSVTKPSKMSGRNEAKFSTIHFQNSSLSKIFTIANILQKKTNTPVFKPHVIGGFAKLFFESKR